MVEEQMGTGMGTVGLGVGGRKPHVQPLGVLAVSATQLKIFAFLLQPAMAIEMVAVVIGGSGGRNLQQCT